MDVQIICLPVTAIIFKSLDFKFYYCLGWSDSFSLMDIGLESLKFESHEYLETQTVVHLIYGGYRIDCFTIVYMLIFDLDCKLFSGLRWPYS